MVTPVALNGAGCAAAVPTANAEANNKAANMLVFIAASPVELDCQLLAMREPISPYAKYHAPSVLKKGKMPPPARANLHLPRAAFSPYPCRGGDRIMLISPTELGGLVPAALAGWPLRVAAQSPNAVERIANYSGDDRQALLKAGPKRE